MVYSFYAPFKKEETFAMIREVIAAMGGKVAKEHTFCLEARWRTPKYRTIFPVSFRFQFDKGLVTATDDSIVPRLRSIRIKIRGYQLIWDHFLQNLLRLYPDIEFGLRTGEGKITAVEMCGAQTQKVLVSTTHDAPSLLGAIIGGKLFGPIGALIGGTDGNSQTIVTETTQNTGKIVIWVRYSNGLHAKGPVRVGSRLHRQIIDSSNAVIEEFPEP